MGVPEAGGVGAAADGELGGGEGLGGDEGEAAGELQGLLRARVVFDA